MRAAISPWRDPEDDECGAQEKCTGCCKDSLVVCDAVRDASSKALKTGNYLSI